MAPWARLPCTCRRPNGLPPSGTHAPPRALPPPSPPSLPALSPRRRTATAGRDPRAVQIRASADPRARRCAAPPGLRRRGAQRARRPRPSLRRATRVAVRPPAFSSPQACPPRRHPQSMGVGTIPSRWIRQAAVLRRACVVPNSTRARAAGAMQVSDVDSHQEEDGRDQHDEQVPESRRRRLARRHSSKVPTGGRGIAGSTALATH